MQLRQIALVAQELAPVRAQIFRILGLESDFADQGVGEFGLENSVMAIGNTFLEVVAPTQANTTAGRLLDRRGGDGGYMVIAQTDNIEPVSKRVDELGIRKVWEVDRPAVTAFHMHPRDIGAAIVSFDEMRPSSEWLWAGEGWRGRRAANVTTISGTTLQATDPEAIARRWSEAFGVTADLADGAFLLRLEEGEIRIEEATDGRGDGVCAVRFDTPDTAPVVDAAMALDIAWNDGELAVCGTRFQFRIV